MTDKPHTRPQHLNRLIAWLNPLQILFDDEEAEWAYYEQYEYRHAPDDFLMGLIITKNVFPDIYFEALRRYHQGQSDRQISQHIIARIEQTYGIPLENLAVHSTYRYGIRFPAYGIATDKAHHMADYCSEHWRVIARLCDAAGMTCVNGPGTTDIPFRLFTHNARSFDAMFYVIEYIDQVYETQYPHSDILPIIRTILTYIAGVFDNPCLNMTDPNQGESMWWERNHADMCVSVTKKRFSSSRTSQMDWIAWQTIPGYSINAATIFNRLTSM